MIDVIQNLTDYEREDLEEVDINGDTYHTGDTEDPEIILAAAFGADMDEESYNERIADAVIDAREHYDDPAVIAQAEVANILEEKGDYDEVHSVGEVYGEDENSTAVSKYTTDEIMEMAFDLAEEEGYDTDSALYVAHPAHAHRVEEIAEEAGFNAEPFLEEEFEWPNEDSQPWVQSPIKWAPREIAARIYQKVKGEA